MIVSRMAVMGPKRITTSAITVSGGSFREEVDEVPKRLPEMGELVHLIDFQIYHLRTHD